MDGRFGTLQEQALGAFISHAEVAMVPSPQMLDDLAAFQQVLFTNPQVRAVADAVAAGSLPPGARVLAVADMYQAMRETRPHRRAISRDEVAATLGAEAD